jgi:hypothetical protein
MNAEIRSGLQENLGCEEERKQEEKERTIRARTYSRQQLTIRKLAFTAKLLAQQPLPRHLLIQT